jgi:membrane carboxypeptidase/penicillin-binding protein
MDPILVKIFATALALSEVMTAPQAVKTKFDPVADQAAVVKILRDGCAHMRHAFDIESINLDELITTALDDPKAAGANAQAFHGINFGDLNTAYHQFCKNESVDKPVVDLAKVIQFFDDAAADLPDAAQLKDKKLPAMSVVLDGKGAHFADVFQPGNRRVWVTLADVPDFVQKAFIAAEDQHFYKHHGIDEHGIIRAFIGNLASPGRPQGGSTITQQVVKNLLVGEDVTYQRKIREMIVASRLENTISKNDILQLYLNTAYLGRGSWGIEMASRSYFGKPAKELTLAQGAMLAGMLKGPSYYNPDRHPDRARERLTYVLDRMKDDGYITAEQKDQALAAPPKPIAFEPLRRDSGFGFVDYLGREAKTDGVNSLTADSYTVHSTINAELQRQTEAALQEGLAKYELSMGRVQFRGPEANLGDAIQKLGGKTNSSPAWQQALNAVHLPLYDVHWTPAVVVSKGGKRGDGAIQVGLADGRVVPLNTYTAQIRRGLNLYDVVYVRVVEGRAPAARSRSRGQNEKTRALPSARADIRVRPTVQGATLVLENKTGRILAMAGSFSYPLSQLNRTWQTERQPGSAIKPLTYLTALQKGLQPNTLIANDPITLPPIGSRGSIISYGSQREEDFWSPRNAGYSTGGVYTLRRGLENSVNMVTAHLLEGGIDPDPERSLDDVCATAVAAKIYKDCIRYYPFVLGAQPVHMIDLAAFYAAVANEGMRPQPHTIDSIEQNGRVVYEYPKVPLFPMIGAADRASFYQLKTILQGVVARGTARAIAALSPYVAGKTGTTEDSVDGWFVGFTNDVTIAVWVGYDNGDGKRRSLGGVDGARVALPIFQPVIDAVWADNIAPKEPLAGPSAEAKRQLIDLPIDYYSGNFERGGSGSGYYERGGGDGYFERSAGRGNFVEHFRVGSDGRIADTQYSMLSHQEADMRREEGYANNGEGGYYGNSNSGWQPFGRGFFGNWGGNNWGNQYPAQPQQPQPRQAPTARGFFAPWSSNPAYQGPLQRDPDNPGGGRFD